MNLFHVLHLCYCGRRTGRHITNIDHWGWCWLLVFIIIFCVLRAFFFIITGGFTTNLVEATVDPPHKHLHVLLRPILDLLLHSTSRVPVLLLPPLNTSPHQLQHWRWTCCHSIDLQGLFLPPSHGLPLLLARGVPIIILACFLLSVELIIRSGSWSLLSWGPTKSISLAAKASWLRSSTPIWVSLAILGFTLITSTKALASTKDWSCRISWPTTWLQLLLWLVPWISAWIIRPSAISLSWWESPVVLRSAWWSLLANQITPFSPSPTLNLIHERDLWRTDTAISISS